MVGGRGDECLFLFLDITRELLLRKGKEGSQQDIFYVILFQEGEAEPNIHHITFFNCIFFSCSSYQKTFISMTMFHDGPND